MFVVHVYACLPRDQIIRAHFGVNRLHYGATGKTRGLKKSGGFSLWGP